MKLLSEVFPCQNIFASPHFFNDKLIYFLGISYHLYATFSPIFFPGSTSLLSSNLALCFQMHTLACPSDASKWKSLKLRLTNFRPADAHFLSKFLFLAEHSGFGFFCLCCPSHPQTNSTKFFLCFQNWNLSYPSFPSYCHYLIVAWTIVICSLLSSHL